MYPVLTLLAGYFWGAIPFGYLVARFKGIDIRQHGSGNIGATNVGRALGLKWFLLVFFLDFSKAAIPVYLVARGYIPQITPEGWHNTAMAAMLGWAILIGNMFPIYLNFRGGKGAATGTGVILPLAWLPTLLAFATFVILFSTTRYVSLGSIGGALALVIAQILLLGRAAFSGEAAPVTTLCLIGAVLVIYRHRTNIARLLAGSENKIGVDKLKSSRENAP